MRFDSRVQAMHWDEAKRLWRLALTSGEAYTARFVVSAIGVLSTPAMPRYEGLDEFEGQVLPYLPLAEGARATGGPPRGRRRERAPRASR